MTDANCFLKSLYNCFCEIESLYATNGARSSKMTTVFHTERNYLLMN